MDRYYIPTTDHPEIYTDGEHTIISLDGSSRPKSIRSQQPIGQGEKLRFSVTRHGAFSFSKKRVVSPQFDAQQKLDGDGEKIPNAEHTRQKERWGYSHEPEFEMENVLLEDANVRLHYDIDRRWWQRNAFTSVKFGDRR